VGPDVSVIMCVYNERLDFLRASINSVLKQTYQNFELIIIDDSDEEVVVKFMENVAEKDSRVIYIHNEPRLGFVKSLNKGLETARGYLIARMDSDDISKENRLDVQRRFLNKNAEVGIIGSSLEKITDDGKTMGVRIYPGSPAKVRRSMMIRNAVAHPTVMMRRDVIEQIGKYDEALGKAEDYELWMRAIKMNIQIANLEEPLLFYRIPQMAKRDNSNWRSNLHVKLKYFGMSDFFWRVVGITLVSLMLILPNKCKEFFYDTYNKVK